MRDRAKRHQAQRGQSTSLLSLPTIHLILGLISVPELARLRATCSRARGLVDSLAIWNEIVQAINENNGFNLTCWHHDRSGQPFVLRATGAGKDLEAGQEDEYDKKQDEEYHERMQDFTGPENAFASKDPRIQASFALLKSFEQCSKLFLFTRAAVERIQKHRPLLMAEDDVIGWGIPDGNQYDSEEYVSKLDRMGEVYGHPGNEPSMRYKACFRLTELNIALSDLRGGGGGVDLYRHDGHYSENTRMQFRYLIAEERTAIRDWLYEMYVHLGEGEENADEWADNKHLESLARRSTPSLKDSADAASERLRLWLGDMLSNHIDVMHDACEHLQELFERLEVDDAKVADELAQWREQMATGMA